MRIIIASQITKWMVHVCIEGGEHPEYYIEYHPVEDSLALERVYDFVLMRFPFNEMRDEITNISYSLYPISERSNIAASPILHRQINVTITLSDSILAQLFSHRFKPHSSVGLGAVIYDENRQPHKQVSKHLKTD
ncbi:MAG: hypothetical protein P0S95_03095 [Rhabdochlamydiaceae bacterium]|nr:hypothetical protein [Candidatus Amphrikana amoebophyrae]